MLCGAHAACRDDVAKSKKEKSLIKPSDAEALMWDSALNRVIDIQRFGAPERKKGGKDNDVKRRLNIIRSQLDLSGKAHLKHRASRQRRINKSGGVFFFFLRINCVAFTY